MDPDQTAEGDAHLALHILNLVRQVGRVSVTELCDALDRYSLQRIVKCLNQLHESHLVRLEMARGEYTVVYLGDHP